MGFLVGFLWLVWLTRRRRNSRGQDRISKSEYASTTDYASTTGYASTVEKPSRFNFHWPFLHFGRSPGAREVEERNLAPTSLPFNDARRSETSIMNHAMRAAYGASMYSSSQESIDEKLQHRQDAINQLAPPSPRSATMRSSLASWFRRTSSAAHPLQQNPNSNSRWSRSTTRTATTTTTDSSERRSGYPPSIYSAYSGEEAPPPMPSFDLLQQYRDGTAGVAAPVPVHTRPPSSSTMMGKTPLLYNSHWSQSSASDYGRGSTALGGPGHGHGRMSSVSSRTQTTMSGGRESVSTATTSSGLAPPGGYQRPTPSFVAQQELTQMRDELLEMYTQGARPPSSVAGGRR